MSPLSYFDPKQVREVLGVFQVLPLCLFHFLQEKCSDQYHYVGNCPPTPPLAQQQSIDSKLGLMLS